MVYEMPEGYKEAISADTRDIDVFVSVGADIDATAADDVTAVEGGFLPMTNTAQMVDANYQMTEWMATFEGDGIKTSADFGNLAPPIEAVAYPPEVGIWSDVISDAQGNIDWTLTIRLSAVHTSALTVYTYDTGILEAEAEFWVGEELQGTATMEAFQGYISETKSFDYDKIVLHVTRLESPYHHVKIVEVEFGASIAYNKRSLTGTVALTQDMDLTMQSIPLHELDFELLNVTGEYDPDNPDGAFDALKLSYPVDFSITIARDGAQFTVPCGRFIITDKVASDTTLKVTCYDSRVTFSQNFSEVSLKTSQSFGDFFTALFADFHIPYEIDDGLFEMYPDQDITFDSTQFDVLTCMLFIEQYFGIWLVPQRNGNIRITTTLPAGEYGLYPPELMYSYPLPSSFQTYNFIQVAYGTTESMMQYTLDLRTDQSQAKTQVSIMNPLVKTEDKAAELAQRIAASMIAAQVETECRADPAIDMNDSIELEGKWSSGNATTFKVIHQELLYDGGLTTTLRTVR